MTMAITAISLLAVAGAPAFATTAKHTRHHVTCKQINSAIDGGKSSEDVQKDLHVTAARVKSCTTPTAKKTPAETKS
jgi:Tfp pilus assembly protein FimT